MGKVISFDIENKKLDHYTEISLLSYMRKRATSYQGSRPTYLVYHKSTGNVYSHFTRNPSHFLMEHPILKSEQTGCIMKIQKRSESNVLSKLH